MIEMVAGILVAAAAVTTVLEPLFRPPRPPAPPATPPEPAILSRAEELVNAAKQKLGTACAHCGHVTASPATFCPQCGRGLHE